MQWQIEVGVLKLNMFQGCFEYPRGSLSFLHRNIIKIAETEAQ